MSQKKLNELNSVLRNYDYMNQSNKEEFHKLSKQFLRKVAKDLDLGQFAVRSNKAGPAVSGEVYLMGMFSEGNGIFIVISGDNGASYMKSPIMYRSITGMKDHTGGHNRWLKHDQMEDYDNVIDFFKTIKE